MVKARYTKKANKAMQALPPVHRKALKEKIEIFAAAPDPDLYTWAAKLTGEPVYRIRQGDWRAMMEIVDEGRVLLVYRVGPRGNVYRNP